MPEGMDCDELLKRKHEPIRELEFIGRDEEQWKDRRFYSNLIKIRIKGKFVGQFEFSDEDQMRIEVILMD